MTKIYQNISEIQNVKLTETFEQYLKIKRENQDCIVMFQIGEFYEAYLDDAVILSEVCSIYLTKRKIAQGSIIMAGIPVKSLEEYVIKLMDNNYKVLVCAQTEKENKIKREIKRIYSKGMIFEDSMLSSSKNNYIASIYSEKGKTGFALADISTGEFSVCEGSLSEILSELKISEPVEVLLPVKSREINPFQIIDEPKPDIEGDFSSFNVTLVKKSSFSNSLVKGENLGYKCANAILEYSNISNKELSPKLGNIKKYCLSDYLMIDDVTSDNLELFKSKDNKIKGSFLWAIDKTTTSMGRRLLINWIKKPLKNIEQIEERELALLEYKTSCDTSKIQDALKNCYDIKRLWGKLTNKTFAPKDFLSLKNTIQQGILIYEYTKNLKNNLIRLNSDTISNLKDLFDILDKAVSEDYENEIIKTGANSAYDAIKNEIEKCIQKIKKYEEDLKKSTGINTLKMGENKVFGYFIEIGNRYIKNLSPEFKIRQNLSNSSRYLTDELIIINEKINSLSFQKIKIEKEIINELRELLIKYSDYIYELTNKLAVIDVINSFYEISKNSNYSKPIFASEDSLKFKGLKHPLGALIIDDYIPNDFEINDLRRFKLLTGPNMAGKSTYMKSVALNIILAQMGSYACGRMYKGFIFDKIFFHSKPDDYINQGSSTFMSEMMDVKKIIENITNKSLVVFDELGSGTSTMDGVKLAYSISKYIIEKIDSVVIFATHFHKLKKLAEKYKDKVQPLMIGEKFNLDSKVFERHVKEGFISESYGLNVARAANLPNEIISDAEKFEV